MRQSPPTPRREYWQRQIAEQEKTGLSASAFCQARGIGLASFYAWRRRLAGNAPVRFALVETGATQEALELLWPTGERLRISAGVDLATLRMVLAAMRP